MNFIKSPTVFSLFNPPTLNKELAVSSIESAHEGGREGATIKLKIVFIFCLTPYGSNISWEVLKSTTIYTLPISGNVTEEQVYSEFKEIMQELIDEVHKEEKKEGLLPTSIEIPSRKELQPEISSMIEYFFHK